MYIVYIDECGFSLNWKKGLSEQPFYVLAAVAIPIANLRDMYEDIRRDLSALEIPGLDERMIGIGQEIKAKDVDRGDNYWQLHDEHRHAVRELYLGVVSKCSGTAFIVIVDKKEHFSKYAYPEEPDILALQFLFERLQGFLEAIDSFAICTFDKTPREEELLSHAEELIKYGSHITYWSNFYGIFIEKNLKLSRIFEFQMQDSKYSLGLQVADFFARHTYSWRKSGKDNSYPGWALIRKTLYERDGRVEGWGYKEFPGGTLDG